MSERAYVAVSGDMLDRLTDLLNAFKGPSAATNPHAFKAFHAAVQQWHDEVKAAADA